MKKSSKIKLCCMMFVVIGVLLEAVISVTTIAFWASSTFLAGMWWTRKVVYLILVADGCWVFKELIWAPIDKWDTLRKRGV